MTDIHRFRHCGTDMDPIICIECAHDFATAGQSGMVNRTVESPGSSGDRHTTPPSVPVAVPGGVADIKMKAIEIHQRRCVCSLPTGDDYAAAEQEIR